jgi:hypothetical protein
MQTGHIFFFFENNNSIRCRNMKKVLGDALPLLCIESDEKYIVKEI